MNFTKPEDVVSVAWQLREADYIRGKDRARINRLFNGQPPYYPDEAEDNNVEININFLEGTVVAHDSRMQLSQGIEKNGKFFTCVTDAGPQHKRRARSVTVTKAINKRIKRSVPYYETRRSKFAGLVLHGIGPCIWPSTNRWRPKAIGVEDLLIPSDTELSFENLPFFCLLRKFTACELLRLKNASKRDPGWNVPLLNSLIDWIDRETMALIGSNFPDIWSPEKIEERIKGDGTALAGDAVPVVNVFDFWYYSDEGKHAGWRRRMVVDDWSPVDGRAAAPYYQRNENMSFSKGRWLYNGRDRVFADDTSQIFTCQFADLSAVPPFKYHSVRSLGYLLYAVCHLQNRLRCAFSTAVFENLMMYFTTKNEDDSQEALTINLINKGFIPPSVQFLAPNERWQPNHQLTQLGLSENAGLISRHSNSWTSSMVNQQYDKREKTKFEVMSELSATTQLVSAALQQAYRYQDIEYREIFRRFCQRDPKDPDVQLFRGECIAQGVPAYMLDCPDAWEVESDKIMGAGNKAMELAIVQQLMATRNLYDPEPQRDILRDYTLAVTDDPARAEAYVPDAPSVSDSRHDAQLRVGTLMQGVQVDNKGGVNHIDVIETLLGALEMMIQRINQTGGVPSTPDELVGLMNVSAHVAKEIQMLAGDESEKERVTAYGKRLSKDNNLLRAFMQRLQEKMQQQNGGMDPEIKAKIDALMLQAKAKAANMRESHAARTAQRQIAFELEEKRKADEWQREQRMAGNEHRQNLRHTAQEHIQDLTAEGLKVRQELAHNRLKMFEE